MKAPEKANSGQLEMGHLLEPIAAHWYAKKTGYTVIDDTNLYQHASHPYALANFDRRFIKPTGEPGTGKTMIQKVILDIYSRHDPEEKVCCCAPTGRAARRMEDSTGVPASTIHRALNLMPGEEGGQDSPEPIDAKLVLVDDGSMLDIYLANKLLDAVMLGSKLVLIEMIASGCVPIVWLDKVFRQEAGSRIAANAKLIRDGYKTMERIKMSDVTDLLGLHGADQNSFYVRCPCCDTEKGKHLNINLKKEVFRCARCGEAGGIFDLYALFTGTPREQARRAIIERIGVYQPQIRRNEPEVRPVENPLAPVAARHKTYMGFLSVLSLTDKHRANLRGRGLPDSAIARLGYKSMPMGSGTALAHRLEERGLQLSGVPGFFRTHSGEWSFVHQQEGILIPVRDIGGQIQGLQVRLDDTDRRKFRWISSGTFSCGSKAQGWVHLAGTPKERIILAEGPLH